MKSTILTILTSILLGSYCFSQKLIKKKVIDKGSITVTGVTSDGKWSGFLLSQDSVLYYLEDGVYWEKKYMNKSVTVSGELRLEKRKYRVEKNENGEIIYSAVLPKHMFIITPFSITPSE